MAIPSATERDRGVEFNRQKPEHAIGIEWLFALIGDLGGSISQTL